MDIQMKYLGPICMGLGVSFIGMVLYRFGKRELGKQIAGEGQDEKEKKVPIFSLVLASQNIWQVAMCISNVVVALFLEIVYAADTLVVLRIVFLCTVLYVCAWTDCRAYLIPNKILLAALLFYIGLFIIEAFLKPWNVSYAAVGAGVSAAALLLAGLLCRLFVPGSVGFGDLKLFVVLGLYLGADCTWNAVFYTLLTSFTVSVFLLVTKRASRKSVMPFAPFLLFGTLLAAFLNGV